MRESFWCHREQLVKWGSCYGWCLACPGFAADRAGGLTAGMTKCRAGKDGDIPGAVRVPATRVFSLHVVQAGSARAAEAAGPAPTAFNRAGEKLRATWGELPRVWAEAGPQREGGLALPLIGEEGQGHPQRCGRISGAGG